MFLWLTLLVELSLSDSCASCVGVQHPLDCYHRSTCRIWYGQQVICYDRSGTRAIICKHSPPLMNAWKSLGVCCYTRSLPHRRMLVRWTFVGGLYPAKKQDYTRSKTPLGGRTPSPSKILPSCFSSLQSCWSRPHCSSRPTARLDPTVRLALTIHSVGRSLVWKFDPSSDSHCRWIKQWKILTNAIDFRQTD